MHCIPAGQVATVLSHFLTAAIAVVVACEIFASPLWMSLEFQGSYFLFMYFFGFSSFHVTFRAPGT